LTQCDKSEAIRERRDHDEGSRGPMSRRPPHLTSTRTRGVSRIAGQIVACPGSPPASWRPPITVLVVAFLSILLAAGCGGSGVHAQTAPLKAQPTAASPSPTGTVLTETQRAGRAAAARVPIYERLLSELAIHRNMSLNKLYSVSTQPDATDEIAFLTHFRAAHDQQRGFVRVVSTKIEKVDLTDRPHQRHPVHPTVHVTACLNVTTVQAVGPGGRSIVPRSRKPYFLSHLVLVNFKYPARRTWLVQRVSATEERSCGG
jgi:hypothetical protein